MGFGVAMSQTIGSTTSNNRFTYASYEAALNSVQGRVSFLGSRPLKTIAPLKLESRLKWATGLKVLGVGQDSGLASSKAPRRRR